MVDIVAETLARHRLPGEALWLEITESVLMEDSLATAGAMAGLRTLGVRLSVDDFGTGYSSLSYLKLFPVSCVKIDRTFVLGLGRHESDSSLVAAIIAMGTALDWSASPKAWRRAIRPNACSRSGAARPRATCTHPLSLPTRCRRWSSSSASSAHPASMRSSVRDPKRGW